MSDPTHEHLRHLFDKALELPAAARQSFLDSKCRGDAELKRRLEMMLAAATDEHFLGASPRPPARGAAAVEAPAPEGPGTRIGPYKLLQQIGEGGFGAVFMAEQTVPVVRKVALKIIKLGMDTRQVVARFEQERQALALMDHAHIARVLDAGATETGRPYFVMDLVKGDPIAEYCDKNSLSIVERLALFEQVCSAVQHAHGKGVIHRDIKSSNVLVGTQDGRPIAKVIDFGIAKATSQKLTDKTLFTEHQQLIGTPAYMSPEQAEGSLDIDTRTDVYSLGVLLYELLTGCLPFDQKTLRRAAYGELLRIIREVDPPRPSTRVSEATEANVQVAARRHTVPRRLGTLIRGELDWIVMKALEKDRQRRYETASGLAMDVARYLAGDAVLAAPPGTVYRLRKFVRRNRTIVTAGAAVAAALLVGVVGFAWQAAVAADQRDRARRAETATAARADELELVADFQASMLYQIDPSRAGKQLTEDVLARHAAALAKDGTPAGDATARDTAFRDEWRKVNATDAARELIDSTILRPAVEAIERQFATQPLVAAKLRQTLAIRYTELSLYDAARPLQTAALATRRALLGDRHPDTLASIHEMGHLCKAEGKLAEAEPLVREALAGRQLELGDEHKETLMSRASLAMLLQEQGRLAEAEPLTRTVLEQRRRVLGSEHKETLASISNVGFLLVDQGKHDEAEPYYRECLELSKRVLGEEHPDTLISLNNYAFLLFSQGKTAAAEPMFREALAKRRRVLGEDHVLSLTSQNNLGMLLHNQGRLAEAEPLLRQALEGRRAVLGPEHPTTMGSLSNFGMLLRAQGDIARAEACFREAFTLYRRVAGEDHVHTLTTAGNLGAALQDLGRLDEAESVLAAAVERSRRALGDRHPDTLRLIGQFGTLRLAQGQPAAAIALLAAAEPAARAVFQGARARRLAVLLKNLGKARAAAGRTAADCAAAAANLLEAEAILCTDPGPRHADTLDCRRALADCYAAWAEAEPEQGHAAQSAAWRAKWESNSAEAASARPTDKK